MHALSPLLFPDTLPAETTLRFLLLFFDTLSHYRPTEDIVPEEKNLLADRGLVRGYAPVSLGDNLRRFNRLVAELNGHGGEFYGGQLSSLSNLAAIDRDVAATWSIASRMTKGGPPDGAAGKEELEEAVWQSLLLLKLAETHQRQEEEIRHGLAAVEKKRAALLKSLRGEDDEEERTDFSLAAADLSSGTPPPVSARRLALAWGRLYLGDSSGKVNHLLATDKIDAAELLFEVYEKMFHTAAVHLCTVRLPNLIALSGQDYLDRRASLRTEAEETLARMADDLQAVLEVQAADDVLDKHKKGLTAAAAKLEEQVLRLQDARTPCEKLDLYLFAGVCPEALFARLCGPQDARTSPTDRQGHQGIMALLRT